MAGTSLIAAAMAMAEPAIAGLSRQWAQKAIENKNKRLTSTWPREKEA